MGERGPKERNDGRIGVAAVETVRAHGEVEVGAGLRPPETRLPPTVHGGWPLGATHGNLQSSGVNAAVLEHQSLPRWRTKPVASKASRPSGLTSRITMLGGACPANAVTGRSGAASGCSVSQSPLNPGQEQFVQIGGKDVVLRHQIEGQFRVRGLHQERLVAQSRTISIAMLGCRCSAEQYFREVGVKSSD